MAQEIYRKLDEVKEHILEIHNAQLEELLRRTSKLVTQVSAQKSLGLVIQLLRQGKPLPVRRTSFNIKKLCNGSEESRRRWEKLQGLDIEALILCTLSFPGLVSLPANQFNWLLSNANRYMEAQGLPSNWVTADQIRKVIANVPRQKDTI